MNPDRAQRSVLITGAAGTLGSALTQQFSSQGWTTFAGFHRTRPSPLDPNVVPLRLDVTQGDDWRNARERIAASTNGLSVLIHNAGIAEDALLPRLTADSWDRTFATNLRPAALGTRALLPLLTQSAPAHVVLVSSLASSIGGTGQAAYAASKAALIGLGESLARELAPEEIRVNIVFPGVLAGPMTQSLSNTARDHLVASNLLQTENDPGEVARFVGFLVSTRNISGQVFNLDSRIRPWA